MNDKLSEIEQVVSNTAAGLKVGFKIVKSQPDRTGRELVIGDAIHIGLVEVEADETRLGKFKPKKGMRPGFYVYAISYWPGNREEPPSEEDVELYLGHSGGNAVRKAFEAYVNVVIDNEFEKEEYNAEARRGTTTDELDASDLRQMGSYDLL